MKKLHISQIKMGALISYCSLALNTITGLLYTPWMISKIGQANYGLYSLATSLITIFMLDFGLGSAVSRFLSKYRAEGNQQAANDIIGVIYKLYIAIDTVIFVVLTVVYFFIGTIYQSLTQSELETFKILYILVAFFNIISFPLSPLNGILNAYEKFIQLKLCDLISKVLTLIFVVIALCMTNSVVAVVLANILSHLIIIFVKWVIVKTAVPLRVNFKAKGKALYSSLFSFTIWTTINSIMQRFTHSFAPSVLGITTSAVEIGIYAPAVTLEGYFYLLSTAVNGLFLPRVSKHIADKNENEILKLMIKIGKYQVMLLGLVFIGFLLVGKEFILLWLGPDFKKTYYCALIILIPTLISGTQQIASTTVIAKNLIRYQSYCMMISGALGLIISFLLSAQIGAMGVCFGTMLTSLINITYMNIIYRKKAGIDMFEYYKKCYLRALPCYLLVIILGFVVTGLITLGGWFGFILKAASVTVIYAVVMLMIYLTKTEIKGLVSRFIKR